MIEEIIMDDVCCAILISRSYSTKGITFITPSNNSQQLGYMNHPKGHIIQPHRHNYVRREITDMQETLFIKSGTVRVDFYNSSNHYVSSRMLLEGDVILLSSGGHGFEIIEDAEIIEVKQGPYGGEGDKTRFTPNASFLANTQI